MGRWAGQRCALGVGGLLGAGDILAEHEGGSHRRFVLDGGGVQPLDRGVVVLSVGDVGAVGADGEGRVYRVGEGPHVEVHAAHEAGRDEGEGAVLGQVVVVEGVCLVDVALALVQVGRDGTAIA